MKMVGVFFLPLKLVVLQVLTLMASYLALVFVFPWFCFIFNFSEKNRTYWIMCIYFLQLGWILRGLIINMYWEGLLSDKHQDEKISGTFSISPQLMWLQKHHKMIELQNSWGLKVSLEVFRSSIFLKEGF